MSFFHYIQVIFVGLYTILSDIIYEYRLAVLGFHSNVILNPILVSIQCLYVCRSVGSLKIDTLKFYIFNFSENKNRIKIVI